MAEAEGFIAIVLAYAAYELLTTHPGIFLALAALGCATVLSLRFFKTRTRFCARCGNEQ